MYQLFWSIMIEYSLSKISNGILVIRTIHWQISFFQACIQVFNHPHEHWCLSFTRRYLFGQTQYWWFYFSQCLSTVQCTNITSPLVFKLCDTQGYLWLSYDLTDVINLTGNIQVKKMLYYSFSIIVLYVGGFTTVA